VGDKCFQAKSLYDNVKMTFFNLEHEILWKKFIMWYS
jgi:hypothetical protein